MDLKLIKLKLEHFFYEKVQDLTLDVRDLWVVSKDNRSEHHELAIAGKALFDRYIELANKYEL